MSTPEGDLIAAVWVALLVVLVTLARTRGKRKNK